MLMSEDLDPLNWNDAVSLWYQTTEKAIIRKEKHLEEEVDDDEEVIYKIEVPANR